MEVRIQSVVVEFILNNVDVLFSSKLSSLIREGAGESEKAPRVGAGCRSRLVIAADSSLQVITLCHVPSPC